MEPKSGHFDWVTALDKSSPAKMFETLKHQARANVDTRNALSEADREKSWRFEFKENDAHHFAVQRVSESGVMAIDFVLSGTSIQVRSEDDTVALTPMLNSKGDLKYVVGEQELDAWQILRLHLEPLFYPLAPRHHAHQASDLGM